MRRLLGALLALALVTSGAHAKGLVIMPTPTGSSNADKGMRVQEDFFINTLVNMGASFDIIRDNQIAAGVGTQNLRRGRYTPDGSGFDTTTYNPIIHLGFRAGSYTGKSYRPDSLTRRIYYPSVTHLFVGNHGEGGSFTSGSICSTGVGATVGYAAAADSEVVTYVVGNPGVRWVQYNGGAQLPVLSTRDERGWRPIWGMRSSAHNGVMQPGAVAASVTDFGAGVYDDSFDGTYPTNPDTVCFWSILNRAAGSSNAYAVGTQAAAVPMFFVQAASQYNTFGGEVSAYAAAIALADSASGGGLGLSTSKKLPLKIAIHIDDGWKRGDSRNGGTVYGGIDIADTTYLKASIDSLRALGEKYVVGVEIDSVGLKAGYDDRWWSIANAPTAHFTPHCHAGTTNATGQVQDVQNSAGPYWRMQDLWGTNNRVRIAWGGGTGLGQDSSLASLHKRAFFLMDSIFTKSRVDHVAMPPGDDWSATYNATVGIGKWPLPMTLDSLLFAWDFAGGRGIRNNSATGTSLVSQRLGSYGYLTGTQDYTIALTATGADDHRGYRGRFVSCPSYPTSASSLSYSRLSAGLGIRAFNSLFLNRIQMSVSGTSQTQDEQARAEIIALHVSDLGGDKFGRPTRPGWYCIKYPAMAARAINAVSAKKVVSFVYPEELCP